MELELVRVRDADDLPQRRFALVRPILDRDLPQLSPWAVEFAVGEVRYPRPGYEEHRWLAVEDGRDVGHLEVSLPQVDNLDNAYLWMHVTHDARGRGVGSALVEHAVDLAREAGRKHVIGAVEAPADGPPVPGMAFAQRHGFVPALEELISVLDLTTLDRGAIEAMTAEAERHAAAYGIETWVGPPADDETCAQLGELEGTLSEDAPSGDLAWEREDWDAERVRLAHANLAAMGVVGLHAVARDRDGRIVAWTQLVTTPSEPDWASQWATVVDPAHRGHRLGAAVKTANLAALRERFPAVRAIDTGNATDNAHMLRVNRAMGFVTRVRAVEHQRDL